MKRKKKKNKKNLINIIIVCIILGIMTGIVVEEYKEKILINKEKEQSLSLYNMQMLSSLYEYEEQNKNQVDSTEIEEETEYPKEQIINEYEGYDVIAKLEIPKIKLETYILKKFSISALNISVTKFWGVNPNEIGNFCVAGHNFQNKNMFHNLKKLEIGDTFFISDNKVGKIEYKIYDLYTVSPDDVSCLSQETNGNREVTLITCTSDSQKRIIVKGREIKS